MRFFFTYVLFTPPQLHAGFWRAYFFLCKTDGHRNLQDKHIYKPPQITALKTNLSTVYFTC